MIIFEPNKNVIMNFKPCHHRFSDIKWTLHQMKVDPEIINKIMNNFKLYQYLYYNEEVYIDLYSEAILPINIPIERRRKKY